MFCRNCGKPLFDGDDFCTFCGAKAQGGTGGPQTGRMDPGEMPGPGEMNNGGNTGMNGTGSRPYAAPAPARKKPGNKTPVFIAIGVAAVLLVGGIAGFFIYTSNDYKRPIKTLVKGIEKADGEKILSAMHPDMVSVMMEQEGMSRKEAASQMETFLGMSDLVGGVKIDYDITSAENMSDEDIDYLEESYEEEGLDLDIDAAKTLQVEMSATVAGMEDSNEMSMTVIKADGKWYWAP